MKLLPTNKKYLGCCLVSVLLAVDLTSTLLTPASADWPEHRGNRQRTGYRDQEIQATHWQPSWLHSSLSPPKPAWPAPATGSLWQKLDHIEARVTDDQADVPLIVQDMTGAMHVLIASSANDRLVAIDPATGKIEWQYVTRAPIRYAPSVANGIAYLGADDGIVRAIDVANGNELWQTCVGPDMPWIIGNDRLISPHPIRTSALVQDGAVYATAGLFPGQGVYAVSLSATTGDVVWRRKIKQSPQGYLLADSQKVFVPTGRSQPFAPNIMDGKFLFDLPSPGGSFCMLTPDAFFSGPGNDSTIQVKPSASGAKMLSFHGKQVVAGGGRIWTANGTKIVCRRLQDVIEGNQEPEWSVACKLDDSMIVSGSETPTVFVAGGSQVELFRASTGTASETLSVGDPSEQIKYLAVSRMPDKQQDLLVASTDSGKLFAWTGGSTPHPKDWSNVPIPAVGQSLASESEISRIEQIKGHLKCPRGWALVLEDGTGGLVDALVKETELRIVSLVSRSADVERLRLEFHRRGLYGHRVTVLPHEQSGQFPFSKSIFNLVLEAETTTYETSQLLDLVAPESGFLWRAELARPQMASSPKGIGNWRHQYASPSNGADSQDAIVGNATAFRLLWFGGVGPSRMPDRHLRGPAPLSTGGATVLQGDGMLIGIDPANGTERWQVLLPEYSMRYVTPFDAGYACLTETGNQLVIAANQELWRIDAYSGRILNKTQVPSKNSMWGYVAESNDRIYASLMKPTAPRTAMDNRTRYTYVNSDYRSERPLVTSRRLDCLRFDGRNDWTHASPGVIANGTFSLNDKHIVFVESRSKKCVEHETDRIPMSILMEEAFLVCLAPETGRIQWEVPVQWEDARNILYAQLANGKVVLTTSKSVDDKAVYAIRVFDAEDGSLTWEQSHPHNKQGLFHGEQVHHPVVLHRPDGSVVLVAEPFLYELANGERVVPTGSPSDWGLRRPGHSCGTISGAGDCLFFRANNPTVLNLSTSSFSALAPTRAGCWINMIPAGGRLLVPEASASCVCNYSIQTSMAFSPVIAGDEASAIPILVDVVPKPDSAARDRPGASN